MKTTASRQLGIALAGALALILPARADTFGSGANTFTIDFVEIGHPGNADDSPFYLINHYTLPYGGVPYAYRMGVTEVPKDWITKVTNLGLTNVTAANADSGSNVNPTMRPARDVSWNEAAAFVNWLNTSTGHHPAYNLTATPGDWVMNLWTSAEAWQAGGENLFRHKDAFYFLPSEDEWYKSAYHKNDGIESHYWLYATRSDFMPDGIDFTTPYIDPVFDAVFADSFTGGCPLFEVTNVGKASSYGTVGQNGNASEFLESAWDGLNNYPFEDRVRRGGEAAAGGDSMHPSHRSQVSATTGGSFRVASVSDPDTDGDGIPDRFETGTGVFVSPTDTGTSPTNPDTDGDGLNDGPEVLTYRTNPLVADTDGDGFLDGYEVLTGKLPLDPLDHSALVAEARTAIEFTFPAAVGKTYRIEASTDLAAWVTVESGIAGTGGEIQRFYSTRNQPKRYFRVEEDSP